MPEITERLSTALADRYQIERRLGAGGMATVYLAEDLKHHRKVAIKIMRLDLAATLGTARFLREVRIAAKLNHPHILGLHDSGEADGFLYYVMPHVEGESLRAKIKREKQLSIDEAVALTRQVASALDYAHDLGVIHREPPDGTRPLPFAKRWYRPSTHHPRRSNGILAALPSYRPTARRDVRLLSSRPPPPAFCPTPA